MKMLPTSNIKILKMGKSFEISTEKFDGSALDCSANCERMRSIPPKTGVVLAKKIQASLLSRRHYYRQCHTRSRT